MYVCVHRCPDFQPDPSAAHPTHTRTHTSFSVLVLNVTDCAPQFMFRSVCLYGAVHSIGCPVALDGADGKLRSG